MKKFFGIALTVTFLTSCEVVLDLEPPKEPTKLVVNSVINPDSLFQVTISQPKNILRSFYDFNRIDNALVSIYDEQNGLIAATTQSVSGVYKLNAKPVAGRLYKITVDKEAFPSAQSSSFVPDPTIINDVEREVLFEETHFSVTIQDDPSEKNYYRIYFSLKYLWEYYDPINKKTVSRIQTSYIELYENRDDLTGSEDKTVFDDLKFNGNNYTFRLAARYGHYGNPNFNNKTLESRIIVQTLSEDYFQYLNTLKLQGLTNGDPFAQPVQVYNNIQGGLGFFGGYSTTIFDLN